MLIKRKPLSRRTFLRGMGVSLALPFLEIMAPTESYAENNTYTGFVYVPNGWYQLSDQFFPEETGSNYTMSQLLEPLSAYRDDFMIISNLDNDGGKNNGDGAGDHARAAGSYLSSVKILKDASQARSGVTIDRHISNITRDSTPIDMLLMGYGTNDGGDSGYNPLSKRLSWKTPTDPIAWSSPEAIFERLVSSQTENSTGIEAEQRRELRKSVLDFVIYDDLPRLNKQLGATDKEKLDSYLSGLRDIERQLDGVVQAQSCDIVDTSNANGTMTQQIDLMTDLMVNAFQCDLTRVAVMSLATEGNNSIPDGLNITHGWHDTSHYTQSIIKQTDYIDIGLWVAERAAYLMNKLNTTNLSQNSLISFGAGSGGNNTEAHGNNNLPTLLMGHANGSVTSGRHLKLDSPTQIANLWSSMAYHAGVPVSNDQWGQYGTGRIDLLST